MAASSREYFANQFKRLDSNRPASRRMAAIGSISFDMREIAPHIAEVASDNPHLNDEGKRAARLEKMREMFVENGRNRLELQRIRQNIQKEMDTLALPTLEKDDVVGEMRQAEARAIVRGMSQEQRDRLGNMSPSLVAAVISAPAELSGVSPSVHAQLRSELIERVHPEKSAAIKLEMEAMQLAELAVKDTQKALVEVAKFAPGGEEAAYLKQIEGQLEKPKSATADPNNLDQWIAEHRPRRGSHSP